ncbi:hypothetical protein IWQ57_002201 [Coemansia nantahalensis]|uniref:Uncharacterized protein n=1 Tax=Coemansia nantahalensis TaxID=2789366 RepID=A0ACC1K1M8_9FUNG|nr:hypothetical protein IWQ57_002201 [Coemansia nantahalensis]
MPSRHRWVGRSTPKPAFTHGPQTPAAGPRTPAKGKRSGGSGSDTVSEDETALRSYSSVQRTRHQSVKIRPLPGGPGMRQVASARAPRVRQPAIRGEALAGGDGSDGDTTETDEEMSSRAPTPVRPRGAVAHRPLGPPAVLHRLAHDQPGSYELAEGGWGRAIPASEPAAHRRSRRRMLNGAHGTVLSKQLIGLVEEGEDRPQESRHSTISLSPSASPSATRRQRARMMPSGSETEADTELPGPILKSETEPEDAVAGSHDARGSLAHGRPAPHTRSLFQGPPALPGYGAGSSQQTHGRRDEPVAVQGGAGAEADSGGETTETDDEFFGPSRAVHASIRPPQRVLRQLAGLRARHVQPTVLDLDGSRPAPRSAYDGGHAVPYAFATGHQPRTAPASGLDAAGGECGLGLGISSGSSRHRNGSARIASTPSRTASGAMAAAINGVLAEQPPGPDVVGRPNGLCRDPGGDEFTFHGAALRRLERSHGRWPPTGPAETAIASRKRALTAPSSLDPPLGRRCAYGPGGRILTSAESLLADASEMASGYRTPPEQGRHMGPRGGFLGESPVSSLRSSLAVRANTPAQSHRASPHHDTPRPAAPAATNTEPSMAIGGMEPAADDDAGPLGVAPGSPSMDAVLRQNRKRIRTPSLTRAAEASPSPSSRMRHGEPPPPPPDVLFPPIDRHDS